MKRIFSGESFIISAVSDALPIKLENFEASVKKNGNLIYWSTLSEINSDYIEVQSSPDGLNNWTVIGVRPAKGESTSRIEYELFDYNPYKVTYYRLNAVDKDGTSEFSKNNKC